MRIAILLAAVLATGCTKAAPACKGDAFDLGKPTLMKPEQAYCVKGLGVKLIDVAMGNTGDGHVLIGKIALEEGNEKREADIDEGTPVKWRGYQVDVSSVGFGWGDPAATVTVTRP